MTLAVEALALLIAGASVPVAGRGLLRAVRSGCSDRRELADPATRARLVAAAGAPASPPVGPAGLTGPVGPVQVMVAFVLPAGAPVPPALAGGQLTAVYPAALPAPVPLRFPSGLEVLPRPVLPPLVPTPPGEVIL